MLKEKMKTPYQYDKKSIIKASEFFGEGY